MMKKYKARFVPKGTGKKKGSTYLGTARPKKKKKLKIKVKPNHPRQRSPDGRYV